MANNNSSSWGVGMDGCKGTMCYPVCDLKGQPWAFLTWGNGELKALLSPSRVLCAQVCRAVLGPGEPCLPGLTVIACGGSLVVSCACPWGFCTFLEWCACSWGGPMPTSAKPVWACLPLVWAQRSKKPGLFRRLQVVPWRLLFLGHLAVWCIL